MMYKGGKPKSPETIDIPLPQGDPFCGASDDRDHVQPLLTNDELAVPEPNNDSGNGGWLSFVLDTRRLTEVNPSQRSQIPGILAAGLCLLIAMLLFRIARTFRNPSVKETDDLRPSDVILGHTAP